MVIPEEILTTVKECVRRFGCCPITLYVKGSRRKIYMRLPIGENNAQRIEIMTQVGIQLAKSDDVGDVEWIIFVSEAWASPARTGRAQLPSQDPNRMEVLLFNSLDAKTNVQELEMYAYVRDRKQSIIDLKPVPMPWKDEGQVDGQLLPSFLAGYRLFKR